MALSIFCLLDIQRESVHRQLLLRPKCRWSTKIGCLTSLNNNRKCNPLLCIVKKEFAHIIFWLAYAILRIATAGTYDMDFFPISIQLIVELPLMMATTYLLTYRFIPLLISSRRITPWLLSILLIIAAVLVRRLMMESILYPLLYQEKDYTFVFFDVYRLVGYTFDFVVVAGLFSAFKFYRDWRIEKSKAGRLVVEKRDAQLRMLRAQVQPHFLFNTLNAIYYEAIKKTDRAAELILKLSDLLRFVLEDCNKDLIPLTAEVELIRNFADLESSRHGHRVKCEIVVQTNEDIYVPPMLFFTLVENAFKYGVSDTGSSSRIAIHIGSDKKSVSIRVTNSIHASGGVPIAGTSLGLGVSNMLQQLELLFGKAYKYSTNVSSSEYVCSLQMPREKA